MSLLPSSPDGRQETEKPRVVDVKSEEADEVFAALSSETARSLLAALHEEPAPAGVLAESVDTSVQNVQYHLNKLESAGAVEVVETAYSEKGREMSVYAPADQPLVVFAGNEEESSTLRTALSRLLGSVGLLAVGSAIIQGLYNQRLFPFGNGDAGSPVGGEGAAGDDEDTATEEDAATVEETATEETVEEDEQAPDDPTADADGEPAAEGENATLGGDGAANATETQPEIPLEETQSAAEAAASLPPGLLFFAGGAFALCVVAVVLYYR